MRTASAFIFISIIILILSGCSGEDIELTSSFKKHSWHGRYESLVFRDDGTCILGRGKDAFGFSYKYDKHNIKIYRDDMTVLLTLTLHEASQTDRPETSGTDFGFYRYYLLANDNSIYYSTDVMYDSVLFHGKWIERMKESYQAEIVKNAYIRPFPDKYHGNLFFVMENRKKTPFLSEAGIGYRCYVGVRTSSKYVIGDKDDYWYHVSIDLPNSNIYVKKRSKLINPDIQEIEGWIFGSDIKLIDDKYYHFVEP